MLIEYEIFSTLGNITYEYSSVSMLSTLKKGSLMCLEWLLARSNAK